MCAARVVRSLHTRQLSAGYGERVILDALSLRLPRGRTTVVLGPGGSGKSTLLGALARTGPVEQGFWIKGSFTGAGTVSMLSQKPASLEQSLSASLPCGDPLEQLRRLWSCVPEAVSVLTKILDTPLTGLPPALRRLAEMTVAMGRPSDLLLLDEPDFVLSDRERGWITQLLRQHRGTRTIVLVTHYLPLARQVADHVVLLVDGVIIEAAEAGRFFERPRRLRTRQFVRMGC